MEREPLLVIGNGMASARLVQELVARAPDRFAITVIGDEPGAAYNRIMLSSLLCADTEACDLPLKPADWWTASRVTVISGIAVTSVSHADRVVTLADGRRIAYSKLVFATGSTALRLPLRGADLPGVFVFRTLYDTEKLAQLGQNKARVTVIGGGLLGIEAAYGLAKRGASVTLVHLMDRLMERQLDAGAAAIVKASLESQNIEVLLDAQSESFLGEAAVEGLRLKDGRVIRADAIVMAAGIRPGSDLAKAAGFPVNRGILVNAQLESEASGVFAIGECAEAEGQCCGLVEPVYAQADILARRLSGEATARYAAMALATNLKVSGLPVFSAGNFIGGEGTSAILLRDPALGLYKKFVTRNGVLEGAVLVGDTADAAWYLKLIREGASISAFRSGLAFGEVFCGLESGVSRLKAA